MTSVSKSFADVLAHFKSRTGELKGQDVLDVVLEQDVGLANKLMYEDNSIPEDEKEEWRVERDTWDLISRLYAERTITDDVSSAIPTPHQLVQSNPYTPTSLLAKRTIQQHPLLRELFLVREWLHDTAPRQSQLPTSSSYRALTRHRVLHAKRGGGGSFVSTLDPDAQGALDPDDAASEKALARALLGLFRAGKFEDAKALCRAAGHDWQAAEIGGITAFKWDSILEKEEAEDGMDVVQSTEWVGNRRRKLWSDVCQRTPKLSPEARAISAALSPARRTLPALLPQCRTWADHAWAHTSALIEERVGNVIESTGSWWQVEDEGIEIDHSWCFYLQFRLSFRLLACLPGSGRLGRVDSSMGTRCQVRDFGLKTCVSRKGRWGRSPIALDSDMSEVLSLVAERLSGGLDTMRKGWIRFFAHLCLFLTIIQQPVPVTASAVILEGYIRVLEAEDQRDLVALYVSALGDNAVDRYAAYLASLPDDLPYDQRADALKLARQHNLVVERVAVATADLIAKKAIKELPPLRGPLPTPADMNDEATPIELRLVKSVEWLLFNQETWETAIYQSNAVLRYMLGMGRMHAARLLVSSLPDALTGSSANGELLGYARFFSVWDAPSVLESIVAQNPGENGTKVEQREWEQQYKSVLDDYYEMAIELLRVYWLGLEYSDSSEWKCLIWGGTKREKVEQMRIRQIYVPEIVLALHRELYNSRDIFPANLRKVLQLPNIIADSRYSIFRDFVSPDGNRMPEYLAGVREAGIAVLGAGVSDPVQAVVS
ncbi:nuclear pore complex protein [Rhizoctonia solani AG-1 IA]|uniref:Nuclear pore complex protein n=1 Tax=Thanatephorus cucumeris (strain AG1-IA) TaxID=983506 RepID=L8WWR5_THACA|nr:nuclear pore complex protein [Rhizoctonia solani AG-1 IA]